MSIYGPEPDPAAIDSPEMRTTLEWLRRFQQATDDGSINRDWNLTTNTVITGKALMQIHGDWMKGEWRAAGKEAGVDFGCIKLPGAVAIVVTVDSWGLLGNQSEAKDAAELDFASVVLDPQVQAEFAAVKGSTPVRLDAPEGSLDACSVEVLHMLSEPAQVPSPHNLVDADWQSSIWVVVLNFWSDPAMTPDDAIEQMKSNYDYLLN
jgi:glucose/mannose transport system substrate-binding protein